MKCFEFKLLRERYNIILFFKILYFLIPLKLIDYSLITEKTKKKKKISGSPLVCKDSSLMFQEKKN